MKAFTIFFITALIAALLLPTGSAAALPGETTIVVTTTTDEYNSTSNSICSLREAITTAVGDTPFGGCTGVNPGEPTRILLAVGTYEMGPGYVNDDNTSGDLDIYEGSGTAELITIAGAGWNDTFIDGNSVDRIFDLNPYASVILQDLAVTAGQSEPSDSHLGYGGGIYNEGTLTLQDVMVSFNTAGRAPNSTPGGGIYNAGTLNLYDSRVHYNGTLSAIASNSAAGGGGIYNNNMLTVERSVISDNTTGNGGDTPDASANGGDGAGIYNNGILQLTSSSISENSAGSSSTSMGKGGNGGGIYNTASTWLFGCTLYGNETGRGYKNDAGDGGGIYNSGSLLMYNTSVIRNTTNYGAMGPTDFGRGGYGGGLYSINSVSVYHSTFAENNNAAGIPNGNGGGIYLTGSGRILQGTIVANNLSSGTSVDCYGDLLNPSYNLIENITGCTFSGTVYGNLTGVDPQFREVQLLGYYLYGFPLSHTSPAVDKVLSCPSGEDQRESPRPLDGDGDDSAVCDMGALELGKPYFIPLLRKP
jgi:CSLREA domain-containing protein